MSSDKETDQPRYYGMELGQVANDADPMGLGRVQVIVPGILDQPGPWAPPIGTLGGGGPQRGFFAVPPKGSDVAVFFHRGDPERPYYMSGHWGSPGGQGTGGDEVPEDVKEAPAEERKDISGFETKDWKITLDDRPSAKKLRLKHKQLDLSIELDGKKGMVEIRGEAALNLVATGAIQINAPQIQIGGRTVIKNGKPI